MSETIELTAEEQAAAGVAEAIVALAWLHAPLSLRGWGPPHLLGTPDGSRWSVVWRRRPVGEPMMALGDVAVDGAWRLPTIQEQARLLLRRLTQADWRTV